MAGQPPENRRVRRLRVNLKFQNPTYTSLICHIPQFAISI